MGTFLHSTLHQGLLLIKYLSASVLIYVYILAAMYLCVDVFNLRKVVSYIFVYATAYLIEYTFTLRFVFNKPHRWKMVAKYVTYILLFLGISTYLFKLLISLDVYYITATLLVAVILMPLRFLTNKYWVYR